LQNDSLSTVLSKINGALSNQGMAATATDDGSGKIKIATNNYGSDQTITVVSDRDSASGTTGFGTFPNTSSGVDIAGAINGHEAIGSGLTLTGASGQPEEGLSLNISQTASGNYGSITVASDTRGTEGASILMNLYSTLGGLTDPLSGPITNAMDGVNKTISNLNDEISSYQDRLSQERDMLTTEYNQADTAMRLLSVTQASLTSQLGSLSK
jgi:flagellar hook-associated protein 2